ncbi:MAG TPA: sialidase family protein, partial [Opitutus sp.]|nr:sialidase family protein [Opitutus sp.]
MSSFLKFISRFSLGCGAMASCVFGADFHRDSLAVSDNAKFTVTQKDYPGLTNPNPRGWYYKCANVVIAKDGSLVASWQISDNHTSLMSHIMVARSTDGGKKWGDYQTIAESSVWVQQGVWVVPQMSVLRDGRIVIVCDWGQRHPGQNMPMLSDWQKPERGMSNHIFWSSDDGKTWTKGEKIDDVGGEPGYIEELSDGTLAYTRTSSAKTTLLKNPPLPWSDIYYRNEIVFSDDGGKTWPRSTWLADSPFHGDCEVGLAEVAPGKIVAASRIGLGNARFGHPSRLHFSSDYGRTWEKPKIAPFYGQRVHLGKLQSGKLLATFRNVWGTPGTRALVFDPIEDAGFQPNSWILDESRCELTGDAITLRTSEGQRSAVEFNLYPAQDDVSRVEIEATVKVDEADLNGVAIGAGCWVRFLPDRICLSDRPETGFDFDTRGWHDYRILREKGTIKIFVDGKEMLSAPIDDIWTREVRFGNRSGRAGPGQATRGEPYMRNRSVSHWRSVKAKVTNADDYSIDWSWTPAKGYPDQFRRDRTVVLDYSYSADCGYSSWTQTPDGKIIIVDYTTGGDLDSFSWGAVD